MQEVSNDQMYKVIEVVKTTPPDGMPGDNWYRYVIRKGKSVVECKKSGTLKTVTAHAQSTAELINSRTGSSYQKKSYASKPAAPAE